MAAAPDQEKRDVAEHDVMEEVDPMVRRSYEVRKSLELVRFNERAI